VILTEVTVTVGLELEDEVDGLVVEEELALDGVESGVELELAVEPLVVEDDDGFAELELLVGVLVVHPARSIMNIADNAIFGSFFIFPPYCI
jgi:hypothetical protein